MQDETHENRFYCTEYDRAQVYSSYRCGRCQERFERNYEGPELDLNGVSLSEALERDARIGRGR